VFFLRKGLIEIIKHSSNFIFKLIFVEYLIINHEDQLTVLRFSAVENTSSTAVYKS